MNQPSSITGLAAQISENSAKVEHYLRKNRLPQPSFLPDGPVNMVISQQDVENARVTAIGASMELLDLLQGPAACLRPSMNATSLEAIYRWDIARHVPFDGDISFVELGRHINMSETNVRRIIRFAITWHRIFREPRPGFVAHSAASRLLVTDESSFDALGMMFDESVQAFARTCDAMKKYDSEEPNHTGYALAHCPNETMWDHYKAHPSWGKRFASSMQAFTSNPGMSPSFLVSGYPWSSLPVDSAVVDIGGSGGHISQALAKDYHHLRFVVQDLPEIINKVQDPEKNSRIEFMAHNFFNPQPRVADVYLLRWILHDWPDSYAVKILQNLIPALKNGAKVVINDQLIPGPGSVALLAERQIRFYDMVMLSLFNARDREEGDWIGLFQQAHTRFQDVKVWTPPGSTFSIIEATWTC